MRGIGGTAIRRAEHPDLRLSVLTGDRLTETQANRFASALLLPRSSFGADCRHAVRGSRLNWKGISELKKKWGTSKAAIISFIFVGFMALNTSGRFNVSQPIGPSSSYRIVS